MPKFHPVELRERVVAHVENGHSHRATAERFLVSIKFVNDMVKLKRNHSICTTLRIQDKSGSVISGSGFGLIGDDAFDDVRFT